MNEELENKIAHIEEKNRQIDQRLTRLEEWVEEWREVAHTVANLAKDAERNNARLVLREAINPWSETTTVEQLLHMLESECPIATVLDALSKKQMTEEESKRLASDLDGIAKDAMNMLAVLHTTKEVSYGNH